MYTYIQAMYLGTNGVKSPSFRLSLRTLKVLVCLVRVLTRKFVCLIYTQSPLRACTHTHIYIHSLSHAHIHCLHVSVRIYCPYICVYMCIYRYICTYTHVYIFVYICMYTHMYLCREIRYMKSDVSHGCLGASCSTDKRIVILQMCVIQHSDV